jgi:hypothetical protein
MSGFHQHQFESLRPVAADMLVPAVQRDELHARMLRDVVVAGRRGVDPAVTTRAVMTAWQWLRQRSLAARRVLHEDLRDAIAQGRTTSKAWLPIAVAETDPALLRAAVTGYIGSVPRSSNAREQAFHDVIDWFRRDLTLDRVAVFEALLALREPEVNARLASLRGRLTIVERDRVCREFAAASDAPTREFCAEWTDGSADTPAQSD